MTASPYTAEQKQQALQYHRDHGPTEAVRLMLNEHGVKIPKQTLSSWARRSGVQTSVLPPPALQAAIETAAGVNEQRRLDLASGLLDDVQGLRARLFAPMTYVHVKVVNAGAGEQTVEQVQVEQDQPVPADQLKLVQSITALIEKVQLLTGEATSRDDGVAGYDLEADLRAFQAGMSAQQQVSATPDGEASR